MQQSNLLLAAAGILFFSGCVKDPIYNTDHPDTAQVTVTTDWSDRGAGVDKPSHYIVSTTGMEEEATADTYTLSKFFDPGNYTFYFYNKASHIQVINGVATVNRVAAPEPAAETFIEPMPDWLFTGSLTLEVEKDNNYESAVAMHQQVRELTLILAPEGGSIDRITGIKCTLTGVARELAISSNTHNESSCVVLEFSKIPAGADAGKWSATVRLLGITGQEQKLSGSIFFENGSPNDVVLESDLSLALSGFNNDKKTPLMLGGQIVEVPTGAGFTATITDWEKVNKGSGIAQ